jgi:ATP-dependent HslUV protease subunit HslV
VTCIAYRAGIIAAESRLGCGTSILGEMQKIARSKDGAVAGAAGEAAYIEAFLAWVRLGHTGERPLPGKDSGSNGILVHPDGALEIIDSGGPFFASAPYWALGSGRPEALGAMFAGADAETAVRAACEHDPYCGGTIRVLKIGKEG